jgi:hypothetical protein
MTNVELIVLKHILTNRSNALTFIQSVEKPIEMFSTDLYLIVKNIFSYIKMYRNIPTLRVLTEGNPNISNEITSKYNLILEQEINETEFSYDLDRLKKAYQSKLILGFKNGLNNVEDYNLDVAKQTLELNKLVRTLESVNGDALFTSANVNDDMEDYISELKSKKPDEEIVSKIKTGLKVFDSCSNGGISADSDLFIVIGESGAGKSQYLNTISINMWLGNNTIDSKIEDIKSGKNIVFFSLEMPRKDCFYRFLSALSDVEYFHIESGNLTKEEKQKIQKARMFIKQYPYKFRIVDFFGKEMSSAIMENILEDISKEIHIDVLVCDYLTLMKVNDGGKSLDSDWLTISQVVREFRNVLRARHIAGVSALQMLPIPDGKYGKEGKVGLHRIARSRDAATHITHCIQIISTDPVKEGNFPDQEYALIKMRKGIKGRKGRIIKDFAKSRVLNDDSFEGESIFSNQSSSEFSEIDEDSLLEIFGDEKL